MRGWDVKSDALFSYVSCEARVPKDHPLRPIRQIVDKALATLSPEFEKLYAKLGRPSIPPERLLRALLLQAFYSVRSELQLMEQLDYNLLFRWFVGLSLDEAVWDETVFTKNGERLIEGDIARRFMAAVLNQEPVKALLSDDHFSVDGTLIEAWASMKSFRPKDGGGEPPAPGRNGERDFHGEKRSNETHASTTDPDARLYRKGPGQPAKLAYLGHVRLDQGGRRFPQDPSSRSGPCRLDIHADCHCLQSRPAAQTGGGRSVAMPAIHPPTAKASKIDAKICFDKQRSATQARVTFDDPTFRFANTEFFSVLLVPHYGLAVFFVLSHLAAGGRSVLLAHGVARRFADRFLIASATAAGLVAFVIMLGMCGARLGFAIP